MTIEGYDGDRVLISYDVAGSERSVAARVCQIVFGRSKDRARRSMERRAEGFIWRCGVVWIGQSVLVMPPKDATDLTERLEKTRRPCGSGTRFDRPIIPRGVPENTPRPCLTC